ncbi:MAG: hypothetical protein ACKVQA_23345 [Burkholderiales bacterium]
METQNCLIALLLTVAACNAAANDAIQVWTDERGHVYYGNAVPGARPERILDTPPLPTMDEQLAAREQAAKDKERLSQWKSSRPPDEDGVAAGTLPCERAAQLVELLRHYHELVLLRPLSTGEILWMTPEERELYLASAMRYVQRECEAAREVSMHDLVAGLFWPRTARAQPESPVILPPDPPVVVGPIRRIKGARPGTAPSIPPSAFVGSKPPTSVASPPSSFVGSKPPVSASNPAAGSLK